MALGGGVWFTQNKKLPGSYINFISRETATATLSDRGYVAIALKLDWGADNEIIEVTPGDMITQSMKFFGYEYSHEKLKPLREIFRNATYAYVYKLNSTTGTGNHAANTYATAKCSGVRGNDITIVIAKNVDDEDLFDVTTVLGGIVVDEQTVASSADLVANDYVTWKSATLQVTAGTPMTGGANATVTVNAHQTFLDKIESYAVNAVGVVSDETGSPSIQVNALYAAWVKRMRDEIGKKLQVVAYNTAADYEGVVNVKNAVTGGETAADLVYWVTGLIGGLAINASGTNRKYDGELTVIADYTQKQLETCIDNGEFAMHKVGEDIRVLTDINSLVTVTVDKGRLFKSNQTIRVIDNIANDIAVIFNTRYIGVVPNDNDGRVSLWKDIVAHHNELQRVRAIENFNEDDVTVERGNEKRAVVVNDVVIPVNAMEQLYMTTIIQ